MVWLSAHEKLSGAGGHSVILLDVDPNIQTKTLTIPDIPVNDARALHIHGVGIQYTSVGAGTRDFILRLSYTGVDVFRFPLDAAVSAAGSSTSRRELISDLIAADASVPTDSWGVAAEGPGSFHWFPPDVWIVKGMTFHVDAYNNLNAADDMQVYVRGRLY